MCRGNSEERLPSKRFLLTESGSERVLDTRGHFFVHEDTRF